MNGEEMADEPANRHSVQWLSPLDNKEEVVAAENHFGDAKEAFNVSSEKGIVSHRPCLVETNDHVESCFYSAF